MSNVVSQMTRDEAIATLEKVCAEFSIGSLAATESVILTNIQNTTRRADCLNAIENYMTNHASELVYEEDEDAMDDCPMNWGDDPKEYLAKFSMQFPELEGVGSRLVSS